MMGGNKPETQRAYFAKWKQKPENRRRLSQLQKDWRARNADAERERLDLRRCAKYGLTIEDFNELLASQDGVCAVCGRPETMRKNSSSGVRQLVIDHDHNTGVVRGLLCSGCNSGIGLFEDDPQRLEQAAAYLRNAKERHAIHLG